MFFLEIISIFTSGDITIAGTGSCTGYIVLELKKDANFDSVE